MECEEKIKGDGKLRNSRSFFPCIDEETNRMTQDTAYEFAREELLIGPERIEKLRKSTVMVLGAGGVGSHCIEALARGGVGRLIRQNVCHPLAPSIFAASYTEYSIFCRPAR